MGLDMSSRLRMFGLGNGHGAKHPLDSWQIWITAKHPELVEQLIEEIHDAGLDMEELAPAYIAAGHSTLFAGCQFFFDTVTGDIYGEEHERSEPGVILHNLDVAKNRCHELVDAAFSQFVAMYNEKVDLINAQLDKEENEIDPNDPPMDGPENMVGDEELSDPDELLNDENLAEHEWEEVDSDLEDENKGDEWKEK